MKPAHVIASEVKSGACSAEEVVAAALERAKAVQERLNAFITIPAGPALARARALDEELAAARDPGPLSGVPVVVKDNICTKGLRTTAGSRMLEWFVPPYSATVVERLEAAGAVVVAKSNLDEFGMGSSNENSAFGPALNPWDPSRVPGGSSGGSAVAVATGVAPLALGTDTGGSVRQPAAWCGLLGFKPTYGRLSRFGVIAFASSLDQVGLHGRSALDLALAMDAASGPDAKDATSLPARPGFARAATDETDLRGLRIGLVEDLNGGCSAAVMGALGATAGRLEALGASVVRVSLPHAPYAVAAYYLIAPAEASSNLSRYDGMFYGARWGEDALGQAEVMKRSRGAGFGAEVRRRVLMGTYALSAGYYDAYYGKAQKVRRLLAADIGLAFERADLLLLPTTTTTAYRLGEKRADPLAMYKGDACTVLANLAGIGALSVPAGRDEVGLPIGVQFLAPALRDEMLLRVAAVLEREAGEAFAPLAPNGL